MELSTSLIKAGTILSTLAELNVLKQELNSVNCLSNKGPLICIKFMFIPFSSLNMSSNIFLLEEKKNRY